MASPTFITGIHWNVESGSTAGNWDGSATSVKLSALPDMLTNGDNAIWVYAPGPIEQDNFRYNCGTTTGSADALRQAINNLSNWSVDASNTTSYTINPFPCSFTVTVSSTTPIVTTTDSSDITATSAVLGGSVTNDGGAAVVERGVVYSNIETTPEIGESMVTKDTNGTGTGSFTESIDSLSQGTTYYFQSYAINSAGTSYGGVAQFKTEGHCGDVSGDDDVDIEDLILALQITAGTSIVPNIHADCDADQRIGMSEALIILKELK